MRQIIALVSMIYDFGEIFVFLLCQNADTQKRPITQLIIIKFRPILCLSHL